jgi:FdhD protein
MMDAYTKRKIVKYQDRSHKKVSDTVAAEKKLRIFLNGKETISLYCTPSLIKELVIGLLVTEGILKNTISPDALCVKENEEIRVEVSASEDDLSAEKSRISRHLGGFTFSNRTKFNKVADTVSLPVKNLKMVFHEFHQKSELFRLTGCFHGAALSDGKNILAFAEDIGRHNTVDKVIGHAMLHNIAFAGTLLLVSCRISSEIASKGTRWGIPVIASRAAPTDLAIDIAESAGITLIGFVRGEGMNIYTNPQRIT